MAEKHQKKNKTKQLEAICGLILMEHYLLIVKAGLARDHCPPPQKKTKKNDGDNMRKRMYLYI